MAEIESLNFDVLMKISSYLNIQDLRSMGLVCKKWYFVYEYTLKQVNKMLCIGIILSTCKRSVQIKNKTLEVWGGNSNRLNMPIKTFASELKKIKIFNENRRAIIPYSVFKSLAKCKRLNYAEIECCSSRQLSYFLKYLPTNNLEHLSLSLRPRYINNNEHPPEILIEDVLSKATKLKSLQLKNLPIAELLLIWDMEALETLFIKSIKNPGMNIYMKKFPNLTTLVISGTRLNISVGIAELMRNCRKLHSIQIDTYRILSEAILNEMMSLPNLRRLSLSAHESYDEKWCKFSNLEDIQISQWEPYLVTRDEIKSFLRRSENLKTYDFRFSKNQHFNETIQDVAFNIGHKCKNEYLPQWTEWCNTVRF
ncbi:hypothetical protein PV327_005138 [Microctonus hyperodae]|uniref:F-box domain-containing protein n=1 Tax=Microctonus hyperodae TaxID=165561 RepID=A0AA39KZF2_MICHY|nr:hypothetical protein PV327_005138 [Microctonus hyperodae]